MTAYRYFAAATILAANVSLMSAPAHAITANQSALQGQGIYTTSKGLPEGYGGGGYAQGDQGYGYREGYRHRGWRRHRRYYNGY